jgi:uncharacterized protein
MSHAMADVLSQYEAILAKVGAFAREVAARRSADLRCRAGCDGCCHVELTVCPLEAEALRRHLAALPAEARARVRRRAVAAPDGRCIMLDDGGTCAVYEARPMVCRTQGLPLRYPPDFVPEEALAGRLGEDGVTWCHLNFTAAAPEPRDVLDAERVDLLLGLANQAHCEAHAQDPLSRIALRALASE